MSEITKEFERVVALARAEQMSMTDFVAEFQKLIKKTAQLEKDAQDLEDVIRKRDTEIGGLKRQIIELKDEVNAQILKLAPQEELEKKEKLYLDKMNWFERDRERFDAHVQYIKRENLILRELLSSVLTKTQISDSAFTEYVNMPDYTDAHGNWHRSTPVPHARHDRNETIIKPNLPDPSL